MARLSKVGITGQARELTPEQELALGAVLQGKTDSEAAELAGVTRQTVNTWRNHDAVFMARLNAERQALWASHADRLRGLVGDAVDVLAEDLQGSDPKARRAAAQFVLKACGLVGVAPSGETSPAAIEREWIMLQAF